MADTFEPRSKTPPVSPTLKYPTLPPSQSMAGWLSQSRPATMTSASHSTERPPSSLSDSWATLSISDTQSEDDTRSEQTDAASLIGQSGPDDVTSLDGRECESEVDENDMQSSYSESQELPPLFHSDEQDGIDGSAMTAKPGYHSSSESIEFEEPDSWPEAERVELKHTIHVFEEGEAAQTMTRLPQSIKSGDRLVAAVQQTMTRHGLDVNQPFRVLYVGDSAFRHIVLDKIGDVLVSSPSDELDSSSSDSSRFHVVPTSFGSGLSPNYAELLPIHVQLVVDDCISATTAAAKDHLGPGSLTLAFRNRPSVDSTWSGSGYQVSSSSDWILPDMAVFLLSDRDDISARRTRHLAQTFAKRHAIPSMVISEQPLWDKPDIMVPVDFQSLHVCLESRNSANGESHVIRRYPIDLKTFESIMPGQLNRNLASLSGLYTKKGHNADLPRDVIRSSTSEKPQKFSFDSLSTIGSYDTIRLLRFITVAFLCTLGLTLGYTSFKYFMLFFLNLFARAAGNNSLSTAHPSSVMHANPTHLTRSANVMTVSVSVGHPTVNTDIQPGCPRDTQQGIHDYLKTLAISDSPPKTEADEFQVHVVGDCHAIIRPPQKITSMKKPPKFDVNVQRGDEELPHTLSKLFDGVYTLKLSREDAYGMLKVSISTKSKPYLSQVSEVDFGTPWLKISGWKRAARGVSSRLMKDLSTAQTGLSDVYVRFSGDMQVWIGDAVKKADFLRRQTEGLRTDSVQRTLASTTGAVMTRSKEYTGIIKREGEKGLATVSSMFLKPAFRLNKETLGFTEEMWSTLQYRAKKIGQSVRSTDLSVLRDKLQEASRSRPLALAQSRARQLLMKRGSPSR